MSNISKSALIIVRPSPLPCGGGQGSGNLGVIGKSTGAVRLDTQGGGGGGVQEPGEIGKKFPNIAQYFAIEKAHH